MCNPLVLADIWKILCNKNKNTVGADSAPRGCASGCFICCFIRDSTQMGQNAAPCTMLGSAWDSNNKHVESEIEDPPTQSDVDLPCAKRARTAPHLVPAAD